MSPVVICVLLLQYDGADAEVRVPAARGAAGAVPRPVPELHPLRALPGRGFHHIRTHETVPAPQLSLSFRRLCCKTTLSILK